MALRFDTTLLCGRRTFEAVGRTSAAFDGSAFSARGASRVPGLRLRYAWELSGVLSGQTVTGELRIAGVRRRDGRRIPCTRHATRRFQARVGAPPAGAPAAARPAAGYLGMSEIDIGGMPGPVVLRTTRDGRKVAARWNAIARCGRGPRERLVNFTPATRIGAAGGFLRRERFTVRYSDAVVRYRVRFGGRFLADGAAGRLRMRAVVMDRRRRVLTRCDTGTRGWHALAEETAAPGAPPAGSPPRRRGRPRARPRRRARIRRRASPTACGRCTWTASPATTSARGRRTTSALPATGSPPAARRTISTTPSTPPAAGASTPRGSSPRRARRCRRASRTPTTPTRRATPSDAGMAMSAESRGCNTGLGSFTVDEIAFAPDRTLQAAAVRWTFRCHRDAPAIRGSWSFHR